MASTSHRVVSREEWTAARKKFLEEEKAFTRERDALSAKRRELPWVKIEKNYVFDTPSGKRSLAELFDGRSQLIVYHFMLAPGWKEGCAGCSFLVDHIDGGLVHLVNHDVSLVVVSRAPLPEIEVFKKRMGWKFPWVSSFGSDFNYDFHVSATQEELANGAMEYNYETTKIESEEQPGLSVFCKDNHGRIYQTYSAYARGGDILINTYNYLDLTPKGRNEEVIMDWMRHHDRYDSSPDRPCCRHENGG